MDPNPLLFTPKRTKTKNRTPDTPKKPKRRQALSPEEIERLRQMGTIRRLSFS